MTEKTSVMHYECDTGHALYQAILDKPDDVVRRLVFADYLEENGDADRAEFIRLNCEVPHGVQVPYLPKRGPVWDRLWFLCGPMRPRREWFPGFDGLKMVYDCAETNRQVAVVRYGFVEEVRCPLGWWLGRDCERCDSQLRAAGLVRHCQCNGTGRTLGHGAEVVARHPVMKVVATDRDPAKNSIGTGFHWSMVFPGYESLRCDLPEGVFNAVNHGGMYKRMTMPGTMLFFPTKESAVEALSDALVDIVRERAGLGQLVRKEDGDR